MAGVGKKILNLFVEVEDDADEKKASVEKRKPVSPVSPAAPVQAVQPDRIPAAVASAGKSDDTIAKTLADALEKANLPGFDYFEYAKMLDALKAGIPVEQTLYQTAFTSGSVMGANKKTLVDSATQYIAVLNKEAEKFAVSVRQSTKDTVTGKEEQVRAIDASIAEKNAQIQKLTEEINALSAEKNSIANTIAENRIKIEKVQNDFAATLQVFLGRIKGDLEKIEKYVAG